MTRLTALLLLALLVSACAPRLAAPVKDAAAYERDLAACAAAARDEWRGAESGGVTPMFTGFWLADAAQLGALLLYVAGVGIVTHEQIVREEIEACLEAKGYAIVREPAADDNVMMPVTPPAVFAPVARDCRAVPIAELRACMGAPTP